MGCEQGYEFVCEKCDKREFVEGDYNKSWILAEFYGWTFTDKGEICPNCSKNSKSREKKNLRSNRMDFR